MKRFDGEHITMTDALTKLLIAKGVFTDEEFKTQLSAERANYLAVLERFALTVMCGAIVVESLFIALS